MKFLKYWADSCINMLYPQYCLSCSSPIDHKDNLLCFSCYSKLKRTDNHLFSSNPVSELFQTAENIDSATSFYYFLKGGVLQKLLHQLKYKSNPEVGYWLGRQMGYGLRDWLDSKDVIIPIPIHRHKKNLRGYNQSEIIAEGIRETKKIPVLSNVLVKTINNESQTNKNKAERIKNVENVYKIRKRRKLKDKNIVLLDDVVTTGSTLHSALREIHSKAEPKSISILVLASQPFL